MGHALSTPFGALKQHELAGAHLGLHGACPLNALRGTETKELTTIAVEFHQGHALSTPFGALKQGHIKRPIGLAEGHALSTPFGALKRDTSGTFALPPRWGMPSQRPSGH